MPLLLLERLRAGETHGFSPWVFLFKYISTSASPAQLASTDPAHANGAGMQNMPFYLLLQKRLRSFRICCAKTKILRFFAATASIGDGGLRDMTPMDGNLRLSRKRKVGQAQMAMEVHRAVVYPRPDRVETRVGISTCAPTPYLFTRAGFTNTTGKTRRPCRDVFYKTLKRSQLKPSQGLFQTQFKPICDHKNRNTSAVVNIRPSRDLSKVFLRSDGRPIQDP